MQNEPLNKNIDKGILTKEIMQRKATNGALDAINISLVDSLNSCVSEEAFLIPSINRLLQFPFLSACSCLANIRITRSVIMLKN